MKQLIKPQRLKCGDTVAAVSLSWGGAGDDEILWRYKQGKERLENVFGLKVIEMPHTLSGSEYVYSHPKERADDFMAAFKDDSVKGIISCIGGDDTIRLLPYLDYNVIHDNPKIFLGYSDTTVNHFMCYKAGLSSFYGGAVLTDFAENVQMSEYTVQQLRKTLFSQEVIGEIPQSPVWTDEFLAWDIENKNTGRSFRANNGYDVIQGSSKVTGNLIGGCLEVIDWLRGTQLFPDIRDFSGAVLFLETSEEKISPSQFMYLMRSLGTVGVLERINGIILGKPMGETYYKEYNNALIQVLAEFSRSDMPVLVNASFGHNEPKCCIPYGAMAEIDCTKKSFKILESGVM